MRIKNKFNAEIKEQEWFYIIAVTVIIVLLAGGNITEAVKAITEWLKTVK